MGLRIYPAIDLKGGQVVRLRRGDMAQATVYSGRPGEQARTFAAQGFGWLHVVDLDGAFAGSAPLTACSRIVTPASSTKALGRSAPRRVPDPAATTTTPTP